MDFEKKTWQNYPNTSTPITASELNRLEGAVDDLVTRTEPLEDIDRRTSKIEEGDPNTWEVMDEDGRRALGVDSGGNTLIGNAILQPGEGWSVEDTDGRIALEIDANGRTHIYDPAFSTAGGNAPIRMNSDAKFNPNPPEQVTYYPTHLDPNDRTTMINYNSAYLRYSRDEGVTWELSHQFDYSVRSGLILDNGEVIVNTRGTGEDDISELWLSKNWQEDPTNAEWTKVHEYITPGSYASGAFSWSHYKNVITAGEYGPKRNVGGREHSSKYMYLSIDYGRTWKTVLDLETDAPGVDPNSEYGVHIHGTLYDPYWDRLWVTYGDSVHGGTDIIYSDDLGNSWHSVGPFPDSRMSHQCVGMYALPNCVLFATDGAPNGVLRIDRRQGKGRGTYQIEVAYRHDEELSLSILCQSVWRANRAGDDAPVIFEFVSAPGEGRRFILSTVDGYDFNVLWESDVVRGNSSGRAYGPTLSGRLLHYAVDEHFTSGGRTLRQGPMPNAY